MKVLIIEDQQEVAEIIADWLKPYSREVLFASNWVEAFKKLENDHPFSLVTLDLGLPDSDRDATARKIPEIRRLNPNGVIIVITGFKDTDLEKEAIRLGADAWWDKPEVTEEKTFLSKLASLFRNLVQMPQGYKTHGKLLEQIAQRISEATKAVQAVPDSQ